jgi:hypothetical protein
MLKGKRHNVLDPLYRHGERVPREAFADDDLDAANIIAGVPMVLIQQLATEVRKPEALKFARLRELFNSMSAALRDSSSNQSTYRMYL